MAIADTSAVKWSPVVPPVSVLSPLPLKYKSLLKGYVTGIDEDYSAVRILPPDVASC